jgi:hypothetical protein
VLSRAAFFFVFVKQAWRIPFCFMLQNGEFIVLSMLLRLLMLCGSTLCCSVSDLDAAAHRQGTFTRSRGSLTSNHTISPPFQSTSHQLSVSLHQRHHSQTFLPSFSNSHQRTLRKTAQRTGVLCRSSLFDRIFFHPSPCRLQQFQRRQVTRQSEQSPHLTVYHPSMFFRLGTY